jgi:peptide/nickel transport system ATP-binding protein
MTDLLNVSDCTKQFTIGGGFSRQTLIAVNQASLVLPSDRPMIYTLAGESGSGKSTLARVILGVHEPTSGTVTYKGEVVHRKRDRADQLRFMSDIQTVFQNPFETFNPLKRVENYLLETARHFRGARTTEEKIGYADEALRIVGLTFDDVRGKHPNEFSGGQLQRVSIARALITNPTLLLADEPVSMVDASLSMSIVNLFKELKEQKSVSVIYITHDLATAYYVSDYIAVMLRGNIVESGPVEDVLDTPRHPYTELLIDSVPVPDPDQKWSEDIVLSKREEKEYAMTGCKFAGRCPIAEDVCWQIDPPLKPVGSVEVRCHLRS